MAVVYLNKQITFVELAKRLAPGDKDLLEIGEVMNERNEMLQDIPWYECNQIFSEKINRRTYLPSGTLRKAYSGVPSTTTGTQIIVEPTALLEDRSEIDEDIVSGAPDPKAFRRSEDIGHVEGLAQQVADLFIEGTQEGAPESITGFQERLSAYSQTNVTDGGCDEASLVTSIYGVDWGRRGAYGIYPSAAANRGKLGLSINDKGLEKTFEDPSTELLAYYVWVTQFKWWIGLVVKDELATCRYANINPIVGGSDSFNEDKLIELMNDCHLRPGTTRLYVNKKIKTQMQIRLKDKLNVNFSTTEGLGGIEVLTFLGAPIRQLDAIKNTEDVLAS